jgi:hypothetical protein
MSYSKEISSQFRGLFVFLLDQSFSMEERLGGRPHTTKKDELALAINNWLQTMAIRATGNEGIKDWVDIGVIGYRTDDMANPILESAIAGVEDPKALRSIRDLGNAPARLEDRKKTEVDPETGEVFESTVQVPVWVEPKAEGGTPMCSALRLAYDIVDEWIQRDNHMMCFPPVVIHITDGESQEGDPIPYAKPLMENLATNDGNVLLFNCNLSMAEADSFMFPHSDEILPNKEARDLFQMSSVFPDTIIARAVAEGFTLSPGARALVFNADVVALIRFIDFGTRIAAMPVLR